jgi:hypothetical protein
MIIGKMLTEPRPQLVCLASINGISPKSWPVILDPSTLQSFCGSLELRGDPGAELPSFADLVEFVGVNERIDWFRVFLKPCLGVSVIEL